MSPARFQALCAPWRKWRCPARINQSINIRFDPNDVTIHDPMPLIDGNNMTRYHPYNRDGSQVPVINDEEETNDPDDSTRSEKQRKRAAQQATTVDPQHVRLQNKLYDSLGTRHGNDAVRYEQDYVDLQVVGQDGCTFHEIKTDSSAKKCIRNALGQILEYSSYPAEQRARKLVVVGDAPTIKYDRAYLKHLRKRYSLPIHYARFNREGETWDRKNDSRRVYEPRHHIVPFVSEPRPTAWVRGKAAAGTKPAPLHSGNRLSCRADPPYPKIEACP